MAERFTQRQGLAQDSVFAIHRSRDGAVWAGTLSGGASLLKDGRVHDLRHQQRPAVEHGRVDSRGRRRHDVVRDAERARARSRAAAGARTRPATACRRTTSTRCSRIAWASIWVGTAKGIAIVEAGRRQARSGSAAAGAARDRFSASPTIAAARSGSPLSTACCASIATPLLSDVVATRADVRRLRRRRWPARRRVGQAPSHPRHGLDRARLVRADSRAVDGRSGARRPIVVSPALTLVEQLTADGAPIDVHGPIRIPSSRRRIAVTLRGS